MRVRPRSEPTTGYHEGGIDRLTERSLTYHLPIVATQATDSAGEILRVAAGDECSFDDPSIA